MSGLDDADRVEEDGRDADRHDEAPDRIRAVRDARYKYIRKYEPDTPYGQEITFRTNVPTMQEILRLGAMDALVPPADD